MRKMIILILIIMIPITILIVVDNYFDDKSNIYIEKEAITIISDIITESIKNTTIMNNAKDLLHFTYDQTNHITGIYIDSQISSSILTNFNKKLSKLLKEGIIEESIENIELPLGMLISKSLFTTIGPDISIEVLPVTLYQTDIKTNVKDYGINNTLFEVYLNVVIELETIIPLKQAKIDYNSNIILTSAIIQGNVPHYYFMGNKSNLS